jgi:hypothetical protein
MANISSLPVEMIDIVASFLNKRDILALRSRCRILRDGTNHEFCKRFFEHRSKSLALLGGFGPC